MTPPPPDASPTSTDSPRRSPWARFLEESSTVCLVVFGPDGTVIASNPAIESRTGRSLAGESLGELMVEPDADQLRRALEEDGNPVDQPVLLNFNGPRDEPFTLRCWWDREGGGLRLVGEPPESARGGSASALLRLNNELAALSRENLRKSRELETARKKLAETLRELKESYWHLKKVQEVIPICMRCQRLRSGDESWDEVAEYFRRNDIFLSHGLCPQCTEEYMRDIDGAESSTSDNGGG